MVGAREGEDLVALPDEGLCQELPEVSEPDDGDLELRRSPVELGVELGLVVVRLSRVEGHDSGAPAPAEERERAAVGGE